MPIKITIARFHSVSMIQTWITLPRLTNLVINSTRAGSRNGVIFMNERKRSKRSCESVCVTREWATPSDALVTQSYSIDTSAQKYSNTTIYVLYMIFAFKTYTRYYLCKYRSCKVKDARKCLT